MADAPTDGRTPAELIARLADLSAELGRLRDALARVTAERDAAIAGRAAMKAERDLWIREYDEIACELAESMED